VVTGVVVVVALVGVAVLGDAVLRNRVEASVAEEVAADLGAPRADVTIAGFPFVAQLVAGTLDRVEVSAPRATVDGVRLDDVEATLLGVSTGTPRTVEDMRLTASLDPAALTAALPQGMTLEGESDRVTVHLDVLGVAIEATLEPSAAGRSIGIALEELTVAGVSVRAGDLPFGIGDALTGLSIPLDGLPEGIELTDVRVADGRIQVAAAGTGVVLPTATSG